MSDECQHGSLRRQCEICERDDEIERLRADLENCHVLRKTTHMMQRFISIRGWGNDGDNMAEILMDRIIAAEKVAEAARKVKNAVTYHDRAAAADALVREIDNADVQREKEER